MAGTHVFQELEMTKQLTTAVFACAIAAMIIGCEGYKTGDPGTDDGGEVRNAAGSSEVTPVSNDICAKCGEAAGSEKCCSEEGKCENCPFHSGTDLCCSGLESTDGKYCGKCGQKKGTEACCAEGAKTCEGCSFVAGSPMCDAKCKAKKSESGGN